MCVVIWRSTSSSEACSDRSPSVHWPQPWPLARLSGFNPPSFHKPAFTWVLIWPTSERWTALSLLWASKEKGPTNPFQQLVSVAWRVLLFICLFLGKISAVSGHVPKRECAGGGLQVHHGSFYQVSITRRHQKFGLPVPLWCVWVGVTPYPWRPNDLYAFNLWNNMERKTTLKGAIVIKVCNQCLSRRSHKE